MLDITRPLTADETNLLNTYPNAIVIWNKVDLPHSNPEVAGIEISAKCKTGLTELKREIVNRIWKNKIPDKGQITLTKERHFSALNEAIDVVDSVIAGFNTGVSPEFLAFDLRQALRSLSQIIGTNVTEDILGAIFAKFCVGK